MTATRPIKSMPFTNGTTMRNTFQERFQTALLSIATTGLLGCFGFLWNVNSILASMKEHQNQKDKTIDDVQLKINTIQLDMREVRDKVIRVETLKTTK